jgi:phospholipase/carboxylesterase
MVFPGYSSDKTAEILGLIHGVAGVSSAKEPQTAIVMAHGRSGDARSMWVFSQVLGVGKRLLVSPQAPFPHSRGGFSWWPEVTEGCGNNSDETVDNTALMMLENFIRKLPEVYPVDPTNIWGVGFSQGAAALASLSLLSPGLLRRVALLSGFLPRTLLRFHREEFAAATIDTKYFIAHGTKDVIVPFSRAEEAAEELRAFGAEVLIVSEEIGHKVGSKSMGELSSWFGERVR